MNGSRPRQSHRTTPTACAAWLCAAISLPLLAAERLAVKTGLWDNTVTIQISDVQLPQEQLARMTPEQRAQLQAMMQQMGVGAPSTQTSQSCITEKDLDGNAFRDSLEQAGQQCAYEQVTATSTRQEWTFRCDADGAATTGRMTLDVLDDSRIRGTMQANAPQGKVDIRFEGQWRAAACGNVD